MKNFLLGAALLTATITKAQIQPMGNGMQPMGNGSSPTPYTWTTDLYSVQSGVDANLGTQSYDPLRLFTNGQNRLEISPDGGLRVSSLADPGNTEIRFLYIDGEGNVSSTSSRQAGDEGESCGGVRPWTLGGNVLPLFNGQMRRNANILGHCSDTSLILEANQRHALFISSNGNVGVGENNENPQTVFDISALPPYPNIPREHLRIYADNDGGIESTASTHFYVDGSSEFRISFGTQAGNFNGTNTDMLQMDAGGMSLYGNEGVHGTLGVTGKTTIGGQTQVGGNHSNAMLTVNGKIVGKEAVVTLGNWADYVFEKNYKLKSLESLESYIKENKHLPNVPSANEVETNGANLGDLIKIQMEKIEELTLYVIELKKESEALKAEMKRLKKQ